MSERDEFKTDMATSFMATSFMATSFGMLGRRDIRLVLVDRLPLTAARTVHERIAMAIMPNLTGVNASM